MQTRPACAPNTASWQPMNPGAVDQLYHDVCLHGCIVPSFGIKLCPAARRCTLCAGVMLQGINTEHILKTRGLTKHFTISGLLVSETHLDCFLCWPAQCWQHIQHERDWPWQCSCTHWPSLSLSPVFLLTILSKTSLQKWTGDAVLRVQRHKFKQQIHVPPSTGPNSLAGVLFFNRPALQESFPDARRLIEAGEMIPDTLVGDLLLEALLLDEPGLQDDLGFVVDGFPRTSCQVGCEAGMTCDAIFNRHFTCCCGCEDVVKASGAPPANVTCRCRLVCILL